MPVLQIMDEELLLKICDSLKPVYYNEHTYIVREGDPIDAMFFIKDGIAWTYTNNNGEVERLENGHYFGEELLELSFSKLYPDSSFLQEPSSKPMEELKPSL